MAAPAYQVEALLDSRTRKRRVEYLVKWAGYNDPADNSWEPRENLVQSPWCQWPRRNLR